MKTFYIDLVYRCSKCKRLVGATLKEKETIPFTIVCKECPGYTDDEINAGIEDINREIEERAKPWIKIGISRSTYYDDLKRTKRNESKRNER